MRNLCGPSYNPSLSTPKATNEKPPAYIHPRWKVHHTCAEELFVYQIRCWSYCGLRRLAAKAVCFFQRTRENPRWQKGAWLAEDPCSDWRGPLFQLVATCFQRVTNLWSCLKFPVLGGLFPHVSIPIPPIL